MERQNCVNRQLSEENSVSRNVCVNGTNSIVQDICNDSCCRVSYSHDLSSKCLETEECVPAYQCDKPSGYVFVDVGSDLIGSVYLREEDDDICKVSSETLFTDSKYIDYNLVKNVNIERCLKNSSKENEMNNHNLETTVFNMNDICSGNDRSGLSTNACIENMCETVHVLDSYHNKPSIDIDCTTTSTVVSASGGFEKVNTYVKEEKNIEDILVHQSTENLNPEIKKEEMVYNEEVSVLNETIIDIKLHPVNKVEEPPDISTKYSCVLDENIKAGLVVLIKTDNSDFHEVHTECIEEVPDNSDSDVMVLKPLKENETVQSKRASHLKLQRTCSELQIKPQTNSGGDDTGADGAEECNNKLSEEDVNTETENKNDAICQHHRKKKSKHITYRHYVCKGCYKDFTQLCDLKAHKCTHTGDRPFACSTCGKAYTRMAHLKDHERIHTGDRPFGCSTCGKAFTRLAYLKNHKLIHTGDRPFGCSTCGKSFTQLTHLQDHKRIHTNERPFGCSTCGKAFTHRATLRVHKHIHASSRPFGCNICGKAFTQDSNLKKHQRIHTSERPFGCSTCGKAFAHDSGLKKHNLIHTGERPFGCSICDKAFTRLADLKVHKHIHTGERPFGCSTCGKAFKNSSNLKAHEQLHIANRTFGCETCGKAFTQLMHLERHKSSHSR